MKVDVAGFMLWTHDGSTPTRALGGKSGVARAVEIIRKAIDVTMALTGTRRIAELDAPILVDSGSRN